MKHHAILHLPPGDRPWNTMPHCTYHQEADHGTPCHIVPTTRGQTMERHAILYLPPGGRPWNPMPYCTYHQGDNNWTPCHSAPTTKGQTMRHLATLYLPPGGKYLDIITCHFIIVAIKI